MAEELKLSEPFRPSLSPEELREAFAGVPLSRVLEEAYQEINGAVNDKKSEDEVVELSDTHLQTVNNYLQYLVLQTAHDKCIKTQVTERYSGIPSFRKFGIHLRREPESRINEELISFSGVFSQIRETYELESFDLNVYDYDAHGQINQTYKLNCDVDANQIRLYSLLRHTPTYRDENTGFEARKDITKLYWLDRRLH